MKRGWRAAAPVLSMLALLAGTQSHLLGQAASSEPKALVERIVGGPEDRRGGALSWLFGREREPLFERPFGVAWVGDDLLVADPAAQKVLLIGTKRRPVTSEKGLFLGPIGVASCRFGVVVSDSRKGRVTLLDSRLRMVRQLADGLERPTGLACDEDRIYVAETGRHRILVVNPRGGVERSFGRRGEGKGEFNFPSALATQGGVLWIGDTLNFRVQAIGLPDGEFRSAFGSLGDAAGETPRVKGIAASPKGRLWISDAHLDQVVGFSTGGSPLVSIGRRGAEAGEFSFPAGVAAHPDGRLAVVDSLNRRVQVIRVAEPEQRKPY